MKGKRTWWDLSGTMALTGNPLGLKVPGGLAQPGTLGCFSCLPGTPSPLVTGAVWFLPEKPPKRFGTL